MFHQFVFRLTRMSQQEDVEVRLCDQEQINEFGRLNNRLLEVRAECKQAKADCVTLDDAISDISMVVEGKVMLFMGETFIETTEEIATTYCENILEVRLANQIVNMYDLLLYAQKMKAKIEAFNSEEKSITTRQAELKKILYARFGNSINLEN